MIRTTNRDVESPKTILRLPCLLGKFNWLHHSKLCILLDENGEFVFNKAGVCKLRTWLSARRVDYTENWKTGVTFDGIDAYACLIALANELLSMLEWKLKATHAA